MLESHLPGSQNVTSLEWGLYRGNQANVRLEPTQWDGQSYEDTEKRRPRTETSGESSPAGILILDPTLPHCKMQLFKLLSLWHFVIKVLAIQSLRPSNVPICLSQIPGPRA
jgi:hypothetical protein